MADNTVLNAGAGGDTIATDDIAGVKYQRVKITTGADGTANDVTNANPVPVSDAGGSLTVDGTVATTQSGTWTVQPGNTANTTAWKVDASSVAVPITDNAGSITVDGTVAVSGTVTVGSHAVTNAGTFATQESGAGLTALQLIDNIVFVEDVPSAGAESGVPALAVRRDAASSGVSADGDWANLSVDSTGALRVTGGGGGTQYAEDSVHASGDSGTLSLVVRRDANTTLVSADGDYSPLQVDANGALKVNITAGAGSGGTASTDDAAFTVASGSGTPIMGCATADTVDSGDVGVVAMTTARELKVNISSGGIAGVVEDAVSAGGEEGVMVLAVRRDSASSGVSADGDFAALSVDSTGALRVAGSAGTTQYAEDVASVGAESLVLMGAVRRDTAASSSGTDGDYSTINVDSTGRLHCNVGNTVTVSGTVTANAGTGTLSVNNAQVAGATLTTGNGVTGSGSQRVTIASDNTAFSVNAAQSGTWTVQPGNTANTTAWLNSLRPGTSGGLSVFHLVSAATTNATNLKASAGQVFGWYIYNSNAAARKVAFHNTAGTPTAGASVVWSLVIPPSSGANVFSDIGIPFATGIAITTVTDLTDAGATAVAASDLIINIFYA